MSTSGGMTKDEMDDWLASRRTIPAILGVVRVRVLTEDSAEEDVLSSSSSLSISSNPSLSGPPHPPPEAVELPAGTPREKEPAPTLPPKSSTPQSSSSSSSSPPSTPADE